MALRLYNTLTKREEEFIPLDPAGKRVTMYTCGPTVYGRTHIGNHASFLMADLLRRWLETGHDYNVIHVKNITDVGHMVADRDAGEDKIEKQAREEFGAVTSETVLQVARTYENMYRSDEAALGMLEPYQRPRASAFVPQMVTMIETLLASGHAYVTDDGIYFDVTTQTRTPYGTLSGNTLDMLNAGARVDVNERKRHPADFALWKFCIGSNVHHVLRWPSPVAPGVPAGLEGFPGWHIECSAMSRAILGDRIDLHTGGEDNIFPHHECEIAQSESVTGKQFVSIWLHKRRIDLEGEKMSKSLGNVLTLSDIFERGYDAADVRMYLLSVHYRTNLKFAWRGLDDAREMRRKIVSAFALVDRLSPEETVHASDDILAEEVRAHAAAFAHAMDSDLNVSSALAEIVAITKYINTHAAAGGVMSDRTLGELRTCIDSMRRTFGCFDPLAHVQVPADVQLLLDERSLARAAKNFAESDRLRIEIGKRGFIVKDTAKGQEVQNS